MPALRSVAAFLMLAAFMPAEASPANAQQPPSPPEARIIVLGEGSVGAVPDFAQVRSGVTTRAKTANEAVEINSKLMAAVTAALLSWGIQQKDIQTAQFSVQPVYESAAPNTPAKLTGFSASNQVNLKIRELARVGEIVDRLIAVGATDVESVEFLHSDSSKLLDHAREAAMADARRKAELYAQAAGLSLGGVAWLTEDSSYAPPVGMKAMRAPAGLAASVPISPGEDTLQVRVTVGYDIAH